MRFCFSDGDFWRVLFKLGILLVFSCGKNLHAGRTTWCNPLIISRSSSKSQFVINITSMPGPKGSPRTAMEYLVHSYVWKQFSRWSFASPHNVFLQGRRWKQLYSQHWMVLWLTICFCSVWSLLFTELSSLSYSKPQRWDRFPCSCSTSNVICRVALPWCKR